MDGIANDFLEAGAVLFMAGLVCFMPRMLFYWYCYDEYFGKITVSRNAYGRLLLIATGMVTMLGCTLGIIAYGFTHQNWLPAICWSLVYLFWNDEFYQGPLAYLWGEERVWN